MISDLINLLFPESPFVDSVKDYISELLGSADGSLTSVDFGCSFIPWDNILACVVLCVFIVCLFKFMRSVFTRRF